MLDGLAAAQIDEKDQGANMDSLYSGLGLKFIGPQIAKKHTVELVHDHSLFRQEQLSWYVLSIKSCIRLTKFDF